MRFGRAALVFLAVAGARPAEAQVVYAPNDFAVTLTARVQPGAATVPAAVLIRAVGRVQRIVVDQRGRRYFAYDLFFDTKEGSESLLVRLEPSSLTPADLAQFGQMLAVDPSWTLVPLVKYPLIPEARAGDTVAIDLLENPRTGQKVVDYLAFSRSKPAAAPETPPIPARDISIADVQVRLKDFRVRVNEVLVDASTRLGGEIAGPALWFYLPERGRFVMSLVANPGLGFRRAGEVTERSLTFTEGQERYEITSADRIVPAGGRFNLYVRHDPGWRPRSDPGVPLLVGAADRAEWVVK